MAIIYDSAGNIIGESEDTIHDWKQAAQVEASLRRELQARPAHPGEPVRYKRKEGEKWEPWILGDPYLCRVYAVLFADGTVFNTHSGWLKGLHCTRCGAPVGEGEICLPCAASVKITGTDSELIERATKRGKADAAEKVLKLERRYRTFAAMMESCAGLMNDDQRAQFRRDVKQMRDIAEALSQLRGDIEGT